MSTIKVIGMGPGNMEEMTPRARAAIEAADLVVGYNTYIDLIQDHFPGKTFIRSGMTREVERCRLVLEKAEEGHQVALISSGDSGIYGMAGIMLEVAGQTGSQVPVEIIPGITAAGAAASVLGAPLMHDFAVISLSDLLTPLDLIYHRVEQAAKGDFILCLYNPKSKKRTQAIRRVQEIVLAHQKGDTPVGVVRNVSRENESCRITDLTHMLEVDMDMFSLVIIGNAATYVKDGKMITPRGYKLEER